MSHILSDSDQSESGEDFSASEDEWTPGKGFDDDEEEEDSEEQALESDTKKTNREPKARKEKAPKRKSASTLRSKLYRKYKPPPKTLNSSVRKLASPPIVRKVTNVLPSTSRTIAAKYESESESSDDGGLVAPEELDFESIAANAAAAAVAKVDREIVPTFDCNAGMRLSDSSDNEDDNAGTSAQAINKDTTEKGSIIGKINAKSSEGVRDFSDFQTFTNNLNAAKVHMKKLEAKHSATNDDTNISELLSLGEGSSKTSNKDEKKTQSRKRKKSEHDADDSDWENVASDDETTIRPKHDIQITVAHGIMRGLSREKKKALDLEACLKRRLNRDMKEKQVFLHKCSLLGWIAHGNYVNPILNNSELMRMCLKHLPSKNSYPNGKTELKYFVSFTKWFHSIFELKSKKMYCGFRPLPPKLRSLALQIRFKHAISKHDYVLIYATMLRAIGIQCRVVINIPVAPLRPPQSELLVVSSKAKADEKVKSSKLNDSKKSKDGVAPQKPPTDPTKKLKNTADAFSDVPLKAEKNEVGKISVRKKAKIPDTSKVEKKIKIPNVEASAPVIQHHEVIALKSSLESSGVSKSIKSVKVEPTNRCTPTNAVDVSSADTPPFSKKNNNNKPRMNTDKEKVSQVISPRKTRSQRSASSVTADNKEKKELVGKSSRAKRDLSLKVPQMDGASDKLPSKRSAESKKAKEASKSSQKKGNDSDSDFAPIPPKRVRSKPLSSSHFAQTERPKSKVLASLKRIDLKVLSDDDVHDEIGTQRLSKITLMDTWVEVYNEKDKKWIVIDPVKNKVDAVDHIRKSASKPIVYAIAWNNDNTIRDVTPRYCNNFHTSTRKLRADPLWLETALSRYYERKNPRTIIEDVEFSKMHMDTPLPTSISEFKNHPLYALERHLLKFEAIYPPNAMILGYIRKEPVYSRDCVHTLHSREIWVKQARTVKMGETPYKIVKARPKWNRLLNEMEEAKPLEIFGFWQTQPYEPPVAENGIVPRNPYGNVELFKPEMLPIGTRHIQLAGLNRTCKKLNVDCAQAVIGFDFHSGSSHPTFDGFVVCEEFADQVVAQWYADQDEMEEKEQKKYEARVYGNWKKLIKGLLIRERLKKKYDFGKPKAK